MEKVRIKQRDVAHTNKLDAVLEISKTVEQVTTVTFAGLVAELNGVVSNIKAMEESKEKIIDMIASVASAQGISEAEFKELKTRVQLDEETATQLLAEIKALTAEKTKEETVEVIGEITTETFIPKVQEVTEEPQAPVEPLPVTEETATEEA